VNALVRILRFVAAWLAPLTLAGAVAAYWLPELFLPFGQVFKWLFAITMLAPRRAPWPATSSSTWPAGRWPSPSP